MKKKLAKILNIVVDVLVILVLVISVLIATLSLTSKSQGVPNLFGYAPLTVESDSMSGTFEEGDLIISKVTNDPGYEYKKGDIVTFPIEIDGIATYNTHKIIKVIPDETITYWGAGKPRCSSRGRPGFRGTLWVASRVPSALSTSNS